MHTTNETQEDELMRRNNSNPNKYYLKCDLEFCCDTRHNMANHPQEYKD